MSDAKRVVVRKEIKDFAEAMERRARYGHKCANDEQQMVLPARFMSLADVIEGVDRNLAQVKDLVRIAVGVEPERPNLLGPRDLLALEQASADAANYIRMAVEKIRQIAEGDRAE